MPLDATKFQNLYIAESTGEDGVKKLVLCGQVSSRNGFGGDTGFQFFAAAPNFAVIADSELAAGTLRILCEHKIADL